MDDLACTNCMWTGKREDHGHSEDCPECGGWVEPIDHDYLPDEKPFNWNKK